MGNILAVSNWDSNQIDLSDAYTNENENAKLISFNTNTSGTNMNGINASGINASGINTSGINASSTNVSIGGGKKTINKRRVQM